jgi:2'-5' RNA ligase
MKNLRTFVAVEVSPEVQARAAHLMDRMRASGIKATWTKPHNLHLTLKFLGDTPETLLVDVCRAVAKASVKVPAFEMKFGGAGAFPSVQRAQTLWLGVTLGTDEVTQLQQSIDEALFPLRYPKERRRFTPHLTLGRSRGGTPQQFAELRQIIENNAEFDAGISIVEEVIVFSSTLDRTAGPTYEVLSRTELP